MAKYTSLNGEFIGQRRSSHIKLNLDVRAVVVFVKEQDRRCTKQ